MSDPRYPIGPFSFAGPVDETPRKQFIADIEQAPAALRAAVKGLSPQQVETPYRDGGWTVRQVVHHFADSHANSYVRFKLALTEDWPTIRPYDEAAWARLPDSRMAIDPSLDFVDGLHARFVGLLEAMTEADFQRGFNHPERGRVTLAHNLAIYDWHSRHHVAHIANLRERMGW